MKFYRKHKKSIVLYISLIIVAFFFNKSLVRILLSIGSLIDYQSITFFIGYGILTTSVVVCYIYVFSKPYFINKKITLFISIVFSIYLILLFTNNRLDFIIVSGTSEYMRFADLILLISITQVIYLIAQNLPFKKSTIAKEDFGNDIQEFKGTTFLEDSPYNEGQIDNELILNRLLGVLSDFMPSSSFCVGLNASWGHGKSSFLKRFELKYKSTNDSNIIFWYNIWKNRESNAIITNFFNELKQSLSPHSGELSNSIDNYVEAILSLSNSELQTIVDAGNKIFNQDKTLESYYKEINSSIKRLNRQVVIILDDLDRLEKDEILSTLKLIRTLSDFNNVIFIAGYDRNYITNKLGIEYAGYIDKIFNVEINFLPSSPNLLSRYLIKEVEIIEKSQRDINKESKDEILSDGFRNLFANTEGLGYSDFFSTYRDVKRFINEFKFNLTFIDNINDVQLDQYILLKLCTFKYRYTQNLIFNNIDSLLALKAIDKVNNELQFASFENQNVYVYDEDSKNKIIKILEEIKVTSNDQRIIERVLVFLFGQRENLDYYINKQNVISKIYYTELYIKNIVVR